MKLIKRLLIVLLLAVFLFSSGMVAITLYQYHVGEEAYQSASDQYAGEGSGQEGLPPLTVDFAKLQEVNPDVAGWLYCEGTPIDYPVLHGADNDKYLHHLYDGSYCYGGSLFAEAQNARDFADYNTIIYGHHMRDGSMFGSLEEWSEQAYYDAHPVFWLLTPGQDYRVDILGAYTTSAYSDTYLTIDGEGPALDDYLKNALAQSLIKARAEPEAGSRYVLLSTCDYTFSGARFVVHGKLVPVNSAGGAGRRDNTAGIGSIGKKKAVTGGESISKEKNET